MKKSLPALEEAITNTEYKKIQILAHGIKGSSANFRIDTLQEIGTKLENMAQEKNTHYDYRGDFFQIQKIIEGIKLR